MDQDMKKGDYNLFHLPKYNKLVTFVSGGFLDDANKKTKLENNDKEEAQNDGVEIDQDDYEADIDVVKDDQDNNADADLDIVIVDFLDDVDDDQLDEEPIQCQIGHDESKCFNLHPCRLCGNTIHLLERCQLNKKVQQKHMHFEWLENWH